MAAAVRAGELGAKVIVLEKLPESAVGGTSAYATGLMGVVSSLSKALGTTTTVDEVFLKTAEYHRYSCNSPVTRRFLENSGPTIDWLLSQGVEFAPGRPGGITFAYAGGDETGRGGVGTGIRKLYEKGKGYGVEFLFETPVEELVVEEGKVTGAIATAPNGDRIAINAPVVILATGGFASSKELFDKYTEFTYENLKDQGLAGRDGDGIALAESAGAALHLPSAVNFCNPSMRGEIEESVPHSVTCNQQPCVWVNQKGARFVNEDTIRDWTKNGNAIALETKTFSIIDTAFLEHVKTNGVWNGATGMPVEVLTPGRPMPDVYELTEMDKKLSEADPVAWKADTIEDLATAMGLDPEALAETIATYNEACAAGVDPLGKPAEYLLPVSTPPFYGFRMLLAFFNTCGGLKVDEYTRVIAKSGDPIPGLYAAGSDAGGVFGYYYDYSIAPGTMQGWCSTSGLLAAEDAVNEYLKV